MKGGDKRMTAKDMSELMGGERYYSTGKGLKFAVIIVDLKASYGNVLVLIHPVDGLGEQWVNINSLS
jgi:hypothetical protein